MEESWLQILSKSQAILEYKSFRSIKSETSHPWWLPKRSSWCCGHRMSWQLPSVENGNFRVVTTAVMSFQINLQNLIAAGSTQAIGPWTKNHEHVSFSFYWKRSCGVYREWLIPILFGGLMYLKWRKNFIHQSNNWLDQRIFGFPSLRGGFSRRKDQEVWKSLVTKSWKYTMT